MEFRHLQCFVMVAECGHFGRAAERLGIVQSAVSHTIKLLEQELGADLLERTRHHVELTEVGRLFLPQARRILLRVEQAKQVANDATAGKAGRLNIGFVDNALWSPLPSILRLFRSRYPDVHVTLRQLDRIPQMAALEESSIDVGIFPAPQFGEDIESELFIKSPLVAAVPSNHRLAGRENIKVDNLANEPFVLFPVGMNTRLVEIIMSACSAAGFAPKVTQEGRQISTLLALVSVGLGVTLVPRWVTSLSPADVFFCNLTTPMPQYELLLAWRRGQMPNIGENFRAVMREGVSNLFQDCAGSGSPSPKSLATTS